MKDLAELRAAALDLAAQFEMPAEEIPRRLAQARDAGYWRGLSPQISIAPDSPFDALTIDPADQAECERFFRDERYFRTPLLLPPSSLAAMNAAIDAVTAAGWPSLFALVSDPFWQLARIPSLRALIGSRLGAGYRQIPHVWVHVVRKVDGAGGWLPHFDGFRPARVSLWFALTDATADNGCMFVVPPNLLPASFRTTEFGQIQMIDAVRAMHATRALPVVAGTAVGWDFDVFHWGGRAVRPDAERRALSMEFVGPGIDGEPDELPLIDLDGPLPALDGRLKVIGIALSHYAKREPLAQRFRPLSTALLDLNG